MFSLLILSFFFNDPATTEIYTLSLHDALPILSSIDMGAPRSLATFSSVARSSGFRWSDSRSDGSYIDRKSTRLNSSHVEISYAVFCLKKKKKQKKKTFDVRQADNPNDDCEHDM